MKKTTLVVSMLLVASLLVSTVSIAQVDYNEFGFYADLEMSASYTEASIYTIVEVFMIITNPYNENESRPIENISGLEFKYIVPDIEAITISTVWVNGTFVDVGPNPNEHIVGWGNPVPVVDGVAFVGTKIFILMTGDPVEIYLSPISFPSIVGHMAIGDYDSFSPQILYPVSGDYAEPIFGFNSVVVAVEKTTLDGLKALYR